MKVGAAVSTKATDKSEEEFNASIQRRLPHVC